MLHPRIVSRRYTKLPRICPNAAQEGAGLEARPHRQARDKGSVLPHPALPAHEVILVERLVVGNERSGRCGAGMPVNGHTDPSDCEVEKAWPSP